MSKKGTSIKLIVVFGCVWVCFGIFGLIEAPERTLVTISQFVAGTLAFIVAFYHWRKAKTR